MSTSFGLLLIENSFKNAYAKLCSAVQNLRLGSIILEGHAIVAVSKIGRDLRVARVHRNDSSNESPMVYHFLGACLQLTLSTWHFILCAQSVRCWKVERTFQERIFLKWVSTSWATFLYTSKIRCRMFVRLVVKHLRLVCIIFQAASCGCLNCNRTMQMRFKSTK